MTKIAASNQLNDKLHEPKKIKQTGFDKWFNVLLCRSDLNAETLDNQPVSFADLVRISNWFLLIA
jgi:hypothetical protein